MKKKQRKKYPSDKRRTVKAVENPGLLAKTIRFAPMTVAKAMERLRVEKGRLREYHAHTLTGLVNELVRRWANGTIQLIPEDTASVLDQARERHRVPGKVVEL